MATGNNTARVWDLPVRICHWSFVLLLPALWWTAENSEMGWHKRLGLLLLALLVFRILWGFVGSSTARFASFVRGPRAVIAYFRGRQAHGQPGHNPAGGWSVMALLLAMAVQVATGLFAGDPYDGATGPLNDIVGVMTADMLTDWHHTVFNAILALVALHLVAVIFYVAVKRDNIVRPMITGARPLPGRLAGMQPVPAWRAFACLAVGAALSLWVANGAPPL
jgi:cytochrome b